MSSQRRTTVPTSDSELADDVTRFVRSFVVLTDAQAIVVTYFVLHTYLAGQCQQTPYLSVTSAERECGKSRLLEVLELVVCDPWMITNPSEAVLFRKVDRDMPTLLWDEIDTVFSPLTAGNNENKRALLDQGNRRHGRVPRFLGNDIVNFNIYCPKVLAGIGNLPDTIASRSLPIRMKRRKSAEVVRDLLLRDVTPVADGLRERLDAWAKAVGQQIVDGRPIMPPEISDRMREATESLVAAADHFGDEHGQLLRKSLIELLVVGERVDSQESMRLRLLRDLRAVFMGLGSPPAVSTEAIISELVSIEEAPWARYYGRTVDAKDIADLLRPYEVKPRSMTYSAGGSRKRVSRRGYYKKDLLDVWDRYLRVDEGASRRLRVVTPPGQPHTIRPRPRPSSLKKQN